MIQRPLSELERNVTGKSVVTVPGQLQARARSKQPIFSVSDGQAQKASLEGRNQSALTM